MWVEIILTVLLLVVIWNITKKPTDYPPGPWGLPIFGYLPLGQKDFEQKLQELKRKHGKIFCWKMGSKTVIFLNDFQTAKDALQTVEFADRPALSSLTFLTEEFNTGLVFTNGHHWNNIRRFTLRHLRELGMGKSKMVSAVQLEASELVESMKNDAGKPKPLTSDIKIAVINVLWQMVASKRYKFNDGEVLEFDKLITKLLDNLNMLMILDFFPWIKKIIPKSILNFITKRDIHEESSNLMRQILQECVDEHQKTIDENNPRDFIDDYLIELEKQKSNPESPMSMRDLIGTTADLFGAGFVTTATAIQFGIYYMTKFPEVQKRLQKEIDEVLGTENQAILDDKARLPYTEAFISEILRYAAQTQFSIPRTVAKDTKLNGYTIPKNSVILPTVEEIHFDSKYFDSPKEFRPERFLNDNGIFVTPKTGFLPFGIGKRQCIGESLARMELLIFLTTLVQHLEFSVPKGESLNITPRDFVFFNAPRLDQNILISVRS